MNPSEGGPTNRRSLIGNLLMFVGGVLGVYMLLNLPDEDFAYSAGYAAGTVLAALLLVWSGWRLRGGGRRG